MKKKGCAGIAKRITDDVTSVAEIGESMMDAWSKLADQHIEALQAQQRREGRFMGLDLPGPLSGARSGLFMPLCIQKESEMWGD